jgi:hypothetical protein
MIGFQMSVKEKDLKIHSPEVVIVRSRLKERCTRSISPSLFRGGKEVPSPADFQIHYI